MYDDDDFEQHQTKTPELPRELREKLVDDSDPNLPAIRYSAIGPEKWPASVAYGARSGFTTWRNPRATDVRIVLNLGPDAQLHVGFEMNLIPPQHRIPRSVATELLKMGQCLRREYGRVVIRIPAGQALAIPAVYDAAIRTIDKNGIVVGGQAHFLVRMVDGKDETDPPEIHPSLVAAGDGDDPPPARSAAARRRR